MDVREKLAELILNADVDEKLGSYDLYELTHERTGCAEYFADYLIAHGVTVQEHGYLETVVEVKDNTVCGNGVKIRYKRCSCCKSPAKFFEDNFCWNCGAKLDLPQPPKGETIYCKDCENLMFSDCYGECAKGHKGIVNPNDTCKYATRRLQKGE